LPIQANDTFIATIEINPESRHFAIGDCNLRAAQPQFASGPVPKEVMVNAVFTLIGEGRAGPRVAIHWLGPRRDRLDDEVSVLACNSRRS
jgi:hypothetical protein